MDEIRFEFFYATTHTIRPRYSNTQLRIGRKGYRAKPVSGEDLNFDAESWCPLSTNTSIRRTTPLICGSQVSLIMRMRFDGKTWHFHASRAGLRLAR